MKRSGFQSHEVIYLDHASTSWPKPASVIEAFSNAISELVGNPGRAAHSMSLAASRAVLDARRKCARLLGVDDPRELVFQPSCTTACNLMLKGALRPGDRVVVGSMEHNAVSRPLAQLAKRGVEVVWVRGDRTGLLDPVDIERTVRSHRTRAVVCQHASNVTGTIQPIPDLADIAHENGALLLVDGAQAVGHIKVDIPVIGADAYAMSGHKGMLGPQGVGLLYVSSRLELEEMVQGGTGGGGDATDMAADGPERYEAGTPNTPGIVGVGAAAELATAEGERRRDHTVEMLRRLHEGVLEIPNLRILGPGLGEPRVPVISLVHESIEPDRIAFLLDRYHGVAVRAGLHCSQGAHETLGTHPTGTLRLSVGSTTLPAAVDAALVALREVVS